MPYPDSEYPSILRGRTKRESQQLLAAAPELLDACEELLIYLGDWDDPDNETCVRARAAIAKAKGDAHGENRRLD